MNKDNLKLLPNFPTDYVPNVIEIHDQLGLMMRIEQMQVTKQNRRPLGYIPNLICWYFDGLNEFNIAYAHTTKEILIDRLSDPIKLQLKVKWTRRAWREKSN